MGRDDEVEVGMILGLDFRGEAGKLRNIGVILEGSTWF